MPVVGAVFATALQTGWSFAHLKANQLATSTPRGHKSPSRPEKAPLLALAGFWGCCVGAEETIADIGTRACCAGAELREKLRRLLLRLPRSLQVEPTAVGADDKALVAGREGGPVAMDGVACINWPGVIAGGGREVMLRPTSKSMEDGP